MNLSFFLSYFGPVLVGLGNENGESGKILNWHTLLVVQFEHGRFTQTGKVDIRPRSRQTIISGAVQKLLSSLLQNLHCT